MVEKNGNEPPEQVQTASAAAPGKRRVRAGARQVTSPWDGSPRSGSPASSSIFSRGAIMQALILWATADFLQEGKLPWMADPDSTVGVSLLAAAVGLVLWFLVLLWSGAKEGRFRIEMNIQKQHYIQACCHLGIYVYWGLYWDGVRNYAPLIAAQIIFAYFFEMLLSWSRGRVWQFRLGPFPIVFSINFFMWFREPYFYLQILMIAFAYLAKEYITWTWEGRRRHIFNPSGITLAVVGLLLLGTGTTGKLTYGYDLSSSFYVPPNLYEVIFLLGLVVMFMFSTTLITFGSFVALWILHGVPDIAAHPVDVYVLLGLTFLLTDPSTSPRNKWGRFLFGLAYGCLIFATNAILRLLDEPPYFDKIFPVPILNLLAPRFEVLGQRVESLLRRPWLPPLRYDWAIYLAMYVGTFCAGMWAFKEDRANFIDPLPAQTDLKHHQSAEMAELQAKHLAVKMVFPEAFGPFGFREEIAHFQKLRDFSPGTALEHDSYGKVLMDMGAPERGIYHIRRALAIDPGCAAAHLDMGKVCLLENKVEEAVGHMRQAVALRPEDAGMHFGLGLALDVQGQKDKAIDHLEQAVNLDPAHVAAHTLLGRTLMLSGRPDDARPHLRQALALSPRDTTARQLLDELEKQGNALPTQSQRKG